MTEPRQQHDQDSLPLFPAVGDGRPLDTRRAAAKRIAPNLRGLRAKVLDYIAGRGARGSTDHEGSKKLRILPDTYRARRTELRDAGLVVDSGRERPSPSGRPAAVWTLANGVTIADASDTDGHGGEDRQGPIGLNQAGLMCEREAEGKCPWCGGRRFWRSIHSVVVCEDCHAPAAESLVVRRFTRGRRGNDDG